MKLNFTGNDYLRTYFSIPYNTATTKRIRVQVRFSVTPSIPSLYVYNEALVGNVSLDDFWAATQTMQTPSQATGYVQFSLDQSGNLTASINRAMLSVSTFDLYAGSSGLYPNFYFLKAGRSTSGTPVVVTNIGGGQNVVVVENTDLSRSVVGGFSFTWS